MKSRAAIVARVSAALCLLWGAACSVLGSDLDHFDQGGGGAAACSAGLDRCGEDCVDTRSNPAHCGACAAACGSSQVCDLGACADDCSAGKTNCDSACVDVSKDPLHCGDCASVCNKGEICGNGTCNLTCFPGQTACGSSCVELQVDDQHCGKCGNNCPTGQACKAGSCEVSCTGSQVECSGACVDTQTNQNHCGGCGVACKAGEACSAGQCKIACPGGQIECSGLCKSLDTDGQNCGACGNACVGNEVCSAGKCSLSCATGETNCSGSCVSLDSDSANCGGCGTACTSTQECSAGKCVIACKTQLNQAITDPWGYSWDGLERAAAAYAPAAQVCSGLGGRLPTASELYRVGATQSATVGQTIHTNYLWSVTPNGVGDQIRVRLSSGSTATGAATSSLNYRCVCPPPLPASFTGKGCYGPAAQGCLSLDTESKKHNIDISDRPPLPKGSAIWECAFYRGHLATPARLVQGIGQGVSTGSNVYLHTADDTRNDSDLILRWQDPKTFDLASGITSSTTTSLRPFRCVGSSQSGTHPSTVADEWIPPGGGAKSETKDSAALGWAAAASACFAKGGHVPTTAELAELVGRGLPGGTNTWLWGADSSTAVLTSATASVLRWTGVSTPAYVGGADLNAQAKTASLAVRCLYYPVDTSYSGPAASACEGGCTEIALPGGSGAKLWFDANNRAPATLQAAIDTCRLNGGHPASGRDLMEAIRAGLANGSNTFIWAGDFSLYLASPTGGYELRATRVRWTGVDPAFADVFGTSSSVSLPASPLAYRCMWTNELR
jgi:hypothetical protein